MESRPPSTPGQLIPSIPQEYPPLHPCPPYLCSRKDFIMVGLHHKSPILGMMLGSAAWGDPFQCPRDKGVQKQTARMSAGARLYCTEEPKRQDTSNLLCTNLRDTVSPWGDY